MTGDTDNPEMDAAGSSGPNLGLGQLTSLLSMLGLPNPLTPVIHTMDQMRRGFDDLLTMIETLNTTLAQLNATAERVNRMLDDVEVPMRTMGDLMRRMSPLTQLADTATGLLVPRPKGKTASRTKSSGDG
jgi:hypothetical protein